MKISLLAVLAVAACGGSVPEQKSPEHFSLVTEAGYELSYACEGDIVLRGSIGRGDFQCRLTTSGLTWEVHGALIAPAERRYYIFNGPLRYVSGSSELAQPDIAIDLHEGNVTGWATVITPLLSGYGVMDAVVTAW